MTQKIYNGKDEILPYIALEPKCLKPDLPIIVHLHGAGRRGDGADEIHLLEGDDFFKLVAEKDDLDCIMVMPQCKQNDFWAAHIQEIKKFIDAVAEKYKADKNRIYLTGVSMGAYGVWLTAEAFPDMFAALVPVCGGGIPWFSDVLRMPIRAFHGTEDSSVLPHNSIDMVNAIRGYGKNNNVELIMLDGVGHNAWEYAYSDELIGWLLSCRSK